MIRPARTSDIPALAWIEYESTRAFDKPIRARAESFGRLPDDAFAPPVAAGHAWVAPDPEDRPAGFVACRLLDGRPYVVELSVLTAHHRRGYGSALLEQAAAWAQPWGVLTLTTFRDVPFNAPFYARRGFTIMEPDADWPELASQLAAERERWSGVAERVAMIRRTGGDPAAR